jgi:hypothetical protein
MNIVENPQWELGIYQLETNDPVMGGAEGIDNLQAKQLANRTAFLKQQADAHAASGDPHTQYMTTAESNAAIAAAVAGLVNASPATLNTLNELAAALGNDPNFATTIASSLASKQPLDATLTAIAAIVTAADKLVYAIGADTFSTTTLTAFARTLLDDANAAAALATLGAAPLASPGLTGIPTAPSAAAGTNTTQLATTAFVQAAISALIAASPGALNTLNELAAALGNDPNFATTIASSLASKQPLDATLTAIAAIVTAADKLVYATGADTFSTTTLTAFARTLLDDANAAAALATLGAAPLASPGLTGTPTAPTAAGGTNNTQLASTAFVQEATSGYLNKAGQTGGTLNLTNAEAINSVIRFSGVLTSNLVVIMPITFKRLWAIHNATSGSFTVTVKTAAGTGVTIAQGKRNLVYTDGTNVLDGFNDFESIAITGISTAPSAAAGTNTTQLATTAFVQAALAGGKFEQSGIAITAAAQTYSVAHGLGATPSEARIDMVCTATDMGYAVGDVIDAISEAYYAAGDNSKLTLWRNPTNVGIAYNGSRLSVAHKTTSAHAIADPTKWTFTIRASK